MRQTFAIAFYCRDSKADKKGFSHIEVSITLNGKRQFLNLPMKVKPKEFNTNRQPSYIQDYVSAQRVRINEILTELTYARQPLTLANIKQYLQTGGYKSYTVLDLVTDYLKLCSARNVALEHQVKYQRTANYLQQFVAPDSECNLITPEVIAKTEAFIRKTYAPATACGYLTKLKAIIRFGVDNNHIQVNPCQNLKVTKPKGKIDMLSVEDLNNIIAHDFSYCERLERVRDLFVLSCGSGLAYCDLSTITPNDFKVVDGYLTISKERQKTKTGFCSVLLPTAKDVAVKYHYNIKQICLSNQKMNSYLKEIADICKVTSVPSLHFHLGRHRYAQSLLDAGVDINILQAAGGWSSSKIILSHYARVKPTTVVDKISKAL